jgi:hypothetical protein
MSAGRNWDRARRQQRMRRWGTESAREDDPPMWPLTKPHLRHRRRPSKQELRREGAAAVAAFQRAPRPVADPNDDVPPWIDTGEPPPWAKP